MRLDDLEQLLRPVPCPLLRLHLSSGQHQAGTCRMGNDPKKFVTNRFGQTHDVPNLYVCDASVFLNCTDKTTTISILAFSLRTSEHLIENFRRGEHKAE